MAELPFQLKESKKKKTEHEAARCSSLSNDVAVNLAVSRFERAIIVSAPVK